MDKIIMQQNQGNSPGTGVMNKALRVLIADDSEDDVVILLHVLRRAGYEPVYERVSTEPAMKAALEQPWDIIISDFEMPHFGGFEALQLLRDSGHDLPFILVSAVVSEEMAVRAMKAGAHDYIMKRNLTRLPPAIERELQEFQTRAARKAAEEALRRSEEQLRQSQKIEAVGRLAAGVAHDFNNFLTAITGHSELLLRQLGAGDPLRKHAEQIEKVAYLAAVLTRQLLSFSRNQVIEPRVLELNAVISNVEKMLCQLIGDDIEFCASLDPAAGHIKADAGQIEQVVMNLAVNARDAMPNGGKLAVTTASVTVDKNHLKNFPGLCAGDYVVITIADTGTGMSEEVKAHLFEPFFTTKPLGKGTGLGLATCFGIVKQNNGHINVQSELGKGATFKIYFPQLPLMLESSPVPIRPPAAAGGDETVLLVEDEPAVREFAVATLREKGYAVVEAVNGEEGLRLARQHDGKIDLVLTDVVMPIMGGKEMADALRASHPDTKILFTSGYTDDALVQHGVLRPDIRFLQKPYMTATLTRKVREVLDEDPTGVAVSITTCP
jgi:two-component system, cell cycle sensor histidine kinase and response regulator CckA